MNPSHYHDEEPAIRQTQAMVDSSAAPDVVLIEAIGRTQRIFFDLGVHLHSSRDVREVVHSLHFGNGPSIDFSTDAELSNGECVSWGLEVGLDCGEWVIESSVRRNHNQGQDTIRILATRYAAGAEDLANELVSAATMVTMILPDEFGMFPGQGYG